MPRRKMRRALRRNGSPVGLSGAGLLVAAGVLALVIAATGIGRLVAENWIIPFYLNFSGQAASSATPPRAAGSQTFIAPAQPIYAVQFGVFSTLEAAQREAESVIARGAAGYILPDAGRYRVLASAYRSADDARKVRDNLKNGQSIDAALYTGGVAEMTLDITGQEKRASELTGAFDSFSGAVHKLMALSEDFDRGSIALAEVEQGVYELMEELASHRSALESVLAAPGKHDVVQKLYDVLDSAGRSLGEIIEAPGKTNVATSAKIKYNVLDMLVAYAAAFGRE